MNIVEIVLGPSSNIFPQIVNKKINITDAHLLLKARTVIGWSEPKSTESSISGRDKFELICQRVIDTNESRDIFFSWLQAFCSQ